MKSKDVLRLLGITRVTLTKYVKEGIIGVTNLPNGRYDYSEQDVYKFLNKDCKRRTVIYARVSTKKQKSDLENQINMLKQFCFSNGYQLSAIYSDIASGISFENRNDFFKMLDDIIAGKIEKVVITYKDRLSRVGFELFKHLFLRFNTEIIVVSEIGSQKLDSEEIFEEIVSLLHCYSMKLYSKRHMNKVKELITEKGDSYEKDQE
ncbi:MAG: IS607 family transposase [Methanobrevibacter sp.]|nr:IS607 family transposase [Methanobrevibacter sp.]MBO7692808.1 IS607 family transposase [Methanobrevibacter sp.]